MPELTPAQRRMGMVDPEEQKLLAARQIIAPPPARNSRVFTPKELERMAMVGQLGMLTGDKSLAPMGEMNLTRAQALTKLEQDRELEERGFEENRPYKDAMIRQMDNAAAFQREELAANLSEAAKDRALKRELEKMGLDAASIDPATGLKATSSAEQKARESERLAAEGQRFKQEMPAGSVSRWKDITSALASKVDPAFGQLLGSLTYDDDQNAWRADADAWDQDLSNLAAGLAVTGFELANKQKWSPRAPGITAEEAKRRFDNITNKFGKKADSIRGASGKGASGGWEVVR